MAVPDLFPALIFLSYLASLYPVDGIKADAGDARRGGVSETVPHYNPLCVVYSLPEFATHPLLTPHGVTSAASDTLCALSTSMIATSTGCRGCAEERSAGGRDTRWRPRVGESDVGPPRVADPCRYVPSRHRMRPHRAEELEERLWQVISIRAPQRPGADPGRLALDEMIEQERQGAHGDPEAETRLWLGKLAEVER